MRSPTWYVHGGASISERLNEPTARATDSSDAVLTNFTFSMGALLGLVRVGATSVTGEGRPPIRMRGGR